MADTPAFETRTPEQLQRATAVSPAALVTVQEPGGPVQGLAIAKLLGKLINVDTAYETEVAPAGLQGDLGHDAFSVGFVFADPTPAKNGWWRKVGGVGAGNWVQFEKLSAQAASEAAAQVTLAVNAKIAGEAARDLAQGYAAGLAGMMPVNALPTIFTHAYFWRKGKDQIIRDLIGTAHVDLATWAGYGVDKDGFITLSGGGQAGLLPAMNHRSLIHVYELPEGGSTGYYFAFGGTGAAIGKGIGGGFTAIPKHYGMHGHGPHKIFRRNDAGGTGFYECEGGGVLCSAAVAGVDKTAGPVMGAANASLSGKIGQMTLIATIVGNSGADPTDAEIEAAVRWLRPFCRNWGKWLRAEDCPRQGIQIPAVGESVDTATLYEAGAICASATNVLTVSNKPTTRVLEVGHAVMRTGFPEKVYITAQLTSTEPGGALGGNGTYRLSVTVGVLGNAAFYIPPMTVAQQNMRSNNVFVTARDNQSTTTLGILPMRWSMRPPYANAAAPSKRAVTPASGWNWGFVRAANEAPDAGLNYYLTGASNGSTQDCPGGSEVAQTLTTDYVNASGGTTTVQAASSRNAKNLVSAGMIGTLVNRNVHRDEQQARKQGIGFTVVHIIESSGINTSYIGTGAVPDAATPLQWFEDKRQYWIDYHGIADPVMTIVKPHRPDGNGDGIADGILGGTVDYPNDAVGTNRLTALGRYRTACDNFAAAHPGKVATIEGDDHMLNTANGDPVHNNFTGYDTLGGAYFARVYAMRDVRNPVVW